MKEERVLDVMDGKVISEGVVENEERMSSIFFKVVDKVGW